MTDPIVSWAVGFLAGGFFGFRSGWLWGRPRMGPPKGSYGPHQPEQPLAADLIRYSRWRSEQIERALCDDPIRLDPGRVQRGNNSGGPTTPKPDIIPTPQSPPGRVVDAWGRTTRYIPRYQGDTPNPPPTDP